MNMNEFFSKYNTDKYFIDLIEDLNIGDAKIEDDYSSTLLHEFPRINDQVTILVRAEKEFFGADLTLKNLKKLQDDGDIDIWITFFRGGEYRGKFIRSDSSVIGMIVIKDGGNFKTPPLWDGTMEMLLEYNGK